MKVAFTIWKERISPLYDASQVLLIVEIKNKEISHRQYEHFQAEMLLKRASRLCELGVEILICGAISEMPSAMIDAYGIQLIPFIAGRAEEVLNAFINGTLHKPVFQMPGCQCRCRNHYCENAINKKKKGENHAKQRRNRPPWTGTCRTKSKS